MPGIWSATHPQFHQRSDYEWTARGSWRLSASRLLDRSQHLTTGQEAPERIPPVDLGPQVHQKADSRIRISLLTCVGTAGFEPATP